jgi:hypothetical protein
VRETVHSREGAVHIDFPIISADSHITKAPTVTWIIATGTSGLVR